MADCGEDATLLIDSKVNASKTLTVSISLVLCHRHLRFITTYRFQSRFPATYKPKPYDHLIGDGRVMERPLRILFTRGSRYEVRILTMIY